MMGNEPLITLGVIILIYDEYQHRYQDDSRISKEELICMI